MKTLLAALQVLAQTLEGATPGSRMDSDQQNLTSCVSFYAMKVVKT